MSPWARDAAPCLGTAVGWDSCEAHRALPWVIRSYRLRAECRTLRPGSNSLVGAPGREASILAEQARASRDHAPRFLGRGNTGKARQRIQYPAPANARARILTPYRSNRLLQTNKNQTGIQQELTKRQRTPPPAPQSLPGACDHGRVSEPPAAVSRRTSGRTRATAPTSGIPARRRGGRHPDPGYRRVRRMRQPPANRQRTTSSESPSAMVHSPDSADPTPSCNALQLAFCRHQPLTESVLPFRPVGAGFSLSQL